MRHFYLIVFFVLALSACTQKQTAKKVTLQSIQGRWYLNKWTSANTLDFSDTTVFVGNSVDTVFTLNYKLSNDTLITWDDASHHKFKSKIVEVTHDNLVLETFYDINEKRVYSRTSKGYK